AWGSLASRTTSRYCKSLLARQTRYCWSREALAERLDKLLCGSRRCIIEIKHVSQSLDDIQGPGYDKSENGSVYEALSRTYETVNV
ncbi:MAG TPA: hypothetical protein VFV38_48495, partial [Ktedonobacteraceae bacterium]|nr:hypothetical protein [Ktedonobacteraceae bacterium]